LVISNLVYSVNKLNKIFFIIFGLFFGLIVLFYGINFSQKNSIIISGSEINSLINIWQDQTGRVPSQDEINIIINNLIEEEVLYKEALKLGLDKDDKIIKRRLIQKLGFYKESEMTSDVNEKDLIKHYHENINIYKINKKYSFRHIFFSETKKNYEEIKLNLSEKSTKDKILGDPFIHGNSFIGKDRAAIDSSFGKGFSKNLINLERNSWHGPFRSIYGDHLIYIFEILPDKIIPFEDVKDTVIESYNNKIKKEEMKNYIYSIIDKYDVIIGDY